MQRVFHTHNGSSVQVPKGQGRHSIGLAKANMRLNIRCSR